MSDEIRPVYVEAVQMPNGEVIHRGQTLGYANTEPADGLSRPNVPVIILKDKNS